MKSSDLDGMLRHLMTPKRYAKAILDLTSLATDDLDAGAKYLDYLEALKGIYLSSLCAFLTTHAESCSTGECLTLVYNSHITDIDATMQRMLKDYVQEFPEIDLSILIGESTNQKAAREINEEIE